MEGRPFGRYLPWILLLLLGGVLAYQLYDSFLTNLHIIFADDQTAIFEEMRRKTVDADAVDARFLEYVVSYYPSDTKQTAGSPLDQVVERARRSAVREIISVLRTRTGLDLGDDPIPWIETLERPLIEKLKAPSNQ